MLRFYCIDFIVPFEDVVAQVLGESETMKALRDGEGEMRRIVGQSCQDLGIVLEDYHFEVEDRKEN